MIIQQLGNENTPSSKLADELVFWVRDNLPSWRDNDPYYVLRAKAMEMFERAMVER